MIKTDGDAERAGRTGPAIEWEFGTAYDFFLSLWVLHQPAMFNVRAAWTAGMRARLPSDARDTLAKAQDAIIVPIHWIHALDPPKNVETVLWTLGRTPAAERMHALMCGPQERGSRLDELLTGIAERGRWTDRERRDVAALLDEAKGPAKRPKNERVQNLLEICADASGFGDAYLAALRAYQEVFFAEEEQRISPFLTAALERARELSRRLEFPDLLEELSQGIRYDAPFPTDHLVIAPSYWITPLTLNGRIGSDRMLLLFGARSSDASIVPGETVPDTLIHALKALADPSRLKILRRIAETPAGTAELARALRLRTPTVMHHLHALRLAGLIQVRMAEKGSKEKARYAVRPAAVSDVFAMLEEFLHSGGER